MKQETKDRIQVWLMSAGMFLIGIAVGLNIALGVLI